MKRLIGLACVVALVASGCSSHKGPPPVGTLTPLGGRVELLVASGWKAVSERTSLSPGDQVRTDAEGGARLQVSSAGSVEIGHDSRIRMGTQGGSELVSGSALAEGSGLTLTLGRDIVRPKETGAFRIHRSLSTLVGVYSGEAELHALGGAVNVPALTQVVIVAEAVPDPPRPLAVSPADPWDRRMLGSAIEVGLGMLTLERGIEGQLEGRPDPAKLFAGALGNNVDAKRVGSLVSAYPFGLGRVFLALAVAGQAHRDLFPTARAILDNLQAGASWIVVVARLDVARTAVLDAISGILASIPGLFVPTPGTTGGPSPSPPPSSPPPTTGPPPTTEPPPTSPTPCASDDTQCQLQQILGGVPTPTPTPSLLPL